jgi:hypothetical protein
VPSALAALASLLSLATSCEPGDPVGALLCVASGVLRCVVLHQC